MKTLTLLLFLSSSIFATEFTKTAWSQWKSEHHKKYTEGPTSYLNATGMAQLNQKGELYLPSGLSKEKTLWTKKKIKNFAAKVVLSKEGQALLIRPHFKPQKIGHERFYWDSKNGIKARLSIGRTSKKLWAYTFDPEQIKKFSGFRFFPFNPKAIVKAYFERTPTKVIDFKTYQNDTSKVRIVGEVTFSFEKKTIKLPAYNWEQDKEQLSYIALIFTEPSSPKFTYAGGRELIFKFSDKGSESQRITLDFNRTINFYCAHSPLWHCPVGLDTKISQSFYAGEMLPKEKIVSTHLTNK